MIDPFLDVLFVGLLLLGALGFGATLSRCIGWTLESVWPDQVLHTAVGLAMLALLLLLLALTHLLYVEVMWALSALWVAIGFFFVVRINPRAFRVPGVLRGDIAWYQLVFLALALLGLVFHGLRAMAPPHGATDPLAYQLALPRIYLAKHYLSFEPSINGTLYPANLNLIYTLLIALRGGSLAQIFHWALLLLSCAAIVGVSRSQTSVRAGLWGAAFFSFTPVAAFYGSQGYIDVGLCFFQIVAVWVLLEWMESGSRRLLLLAGLLAGVATGIKLHGAIIIAFGVAVVLWRTWRQGRRSCALQVVTYGGAAVVLVLPWLVRSYVEAGNPVWPLANQFFNGREFGHEMMGVPGFVQNSVGDGAGGGTWIGGIVAGVIHRLATKIPALWQWTWAPQTMQHHVGPYWLALLPALLVAGGGRRVLRVLLFSAAYYLMVLLLLQTNPRYSLVLFAFLAVLAGHAVEGVLRRRSTWAGVVVVTILVGSAVANTAWSYWLARPMLPLITGAESEAQFLRKNESTYSLYEFVNKNLPESSRVLLQGAVKGYYCDRDYMWDHPLQRELDYAKYEDEDGLYRRMGELGITHIARLIRVPDSRVHLGYPQYFLDQFHERFRKRYLTLLYRDQVFALFEIRPLPPASGSG